MDATEKLIQEALTSTDPFILALAHAALLRLAAGGKLNKVTASGRTLDMQVIATVGSIDPTSVCEDPNCAQRGEMYKDHTVVHKAKGAKKGLRGVCPECEGPMHNLKDDAKLIAFACLWRQAFGPDARKTPVSATSLAAVVKKIQDGSIKKWADRNLMLTILAGPVPKGVAAAPAASVSSGSVATSTATTVAPPSAKPTQSAPVAASKAAPDPDKQKKLRELLKGAKVTP